LLTSPSFHLQVITVRGNQALAREAVIEAAGLRTGTSLLRVRLGVARQALLELPRVKSATLRRVWPNGLDVLVVERTGVALLPCGQGWVEAAGDGMALELHTSASGVELPVLDGVEPATVGVGEIVPAAAARMALAGLEAFAAAGEGVSSARIAASDMEVTLPDGTAVYLGQADAGLAVRVETAVRIAAELRSRGLRVEYIDVRIPGQPVYKPR